MLVLLDALMDLLRKADEDTWELVEEGSFGQPAFCASWVLTWFAHDIKKLDDVKRIYDVCLSQHPIFPIYLAVATILYNKVRLEENFDWEDPQTSIFLVFQKIGEKLDAFESETIIQSALRLVKDFPPESIAKRK